MRGVEMAFSFEVDEDSVDIVFARSEAGARGKVARRQGVSFAEAEVERREAFDKYAPGPVTMEDFHDEGWTVSCQWCEHRVDGDCCYKCADNTGDDPYESPPPVAQDGLVYCNKNCRDNQLAYWQRIKAAKASATEQLLVKWPWVVPLGAWVGGHGGECKCYDTNRENICVRFKVPGGELSEKTIDGNAFHNTFCATCKHVWIARGDYEAWHALATVKPDVVVG